MARIELLADHLDLLPLLAEWHFREWSHLRHGETPEDGVRRLRECARPGGIPSTFIAIADGQLIGSASLVRNDMEIRMSLSPWLSDVYVAPAHRRRGVGSLLVRRVVQEAGGLGVPRLFLFTTSRENERLYAGLGWSVRERVEYRGKLRVIMQIDVTEPHVDS